MAKRVFFSFHYSNDNWRASQVRNIGILDGNRSATDNDWEQIKQGGDAAIQRWIDNQMDGKSTVAVLIGSQTAGRRWINYEIKRAWDIGKAVLGVRIHQLKNRLGQTSVQGANPFSEFSIRGQNLANIVPILDAGPCDSQTAYNRIAAQIGDYIEHAKVIRDRN
ncbi:TIR domain-containing protein [Vannielia sp. SX4]|uniref:TIR domain-containing protein n=1 Tax=Vannielia sp. SX4 TaxID=3463852 RepID=UPI004058C6C5